MPQKKRYQVFISSTYEDLKDERQAAVETILSMKHFPVGMEQWPAIDEDKFEFIKRVIDESDYFLLILGGKYGTQAPDKLSYTEKEYDYALEKRLRVIVLHHGEPSQLIGERLEASPARRKALEKFTRKATNGRLAKTWTKSDHIRNHLQASLNLTIETYPASGWLPANGLATEDMLTRLVDLQGENAELRSMLTNEHAPMPGIAHLTEEYTLEGDIFDGDLIKHPWSLSLTWHQIFMSIALAMEAHCEGELIFQSLAGRFLLTTEFGANKTTYLKWSNRTMHDLSVQMRGYRFITITDTGRRAVWRLTPSGQNLLLEALIIRTSKGQASPAPSE